MAKTTLGDSTPSNSISDTDLLRVLVALAGRIAFPAPELLELVGRSYLGSYNMCTGLLSLSAIARVTGVDKSNLRKAVVKWEEAGVIFRVGPEQWPLHLYPLPIPAGDRRTSRTESVGSEVTEPEQGGAT